MRFLVLILGVLTMAQCATGDGGRFRVGRSDNAFVIIGVAEASENREARYTLLWRQVEGAAFAELDGDKTFEAKTNQGDTIRIDGIPGEFQLLEIEPGEYALDSVFGLIRDQRVNYSAEGVVVGPERPAFTVRPGEAVYLGIWQVTLDYDRAVARPWRLQESDLRAVLAETDEIRGQVRIRETATRRVACSPRRLNHRSRRQVC
jgi:hypothetical protein